MRATITAAIAAKKVHRTYWCALSLRTFHRKDGLLVKESENTISAVRYAVMMKRHGTSQHGRNRFYREINYPQSSIA